MNFLDNNIIDKENNIIDTNENMEIENILKGSINLNKNKIEVNYDKLKNLESYDFYNKLKSPDYITNLNNMYSLGLLKFDENNSPIFEEYVELNIIENNLKPRIAGWANIDFSKCKIWAVSKRYWFGKWELHFNNYLTNILIDLGSDISLLLSILTLFPAASPVLSVIALYIAAVTWLISNVNRGNGVYISIVVIVPTGIYSN